MIRDPVSNRDERDLHLNLLISSPGQIIPNILGIRLTPVLFYLLKCFLPPSFDVAGTLDTSRYKLRILTRIPASPYIFYWLSQSRPFSCAIPTAGSYSWPARRARLPITDKRKEPPDLEPAPRQTYIDLAATQFQSRILDFELDVASLLGGFHHSRRLIPRTILIWELLEDLGWLGSWTMASWTRASRQLSQ